MAVLSKQYIIIASELFLLVLSTTILHAVDGLAGNKKRNRQPSRPIDSHHGRAGDSNINATNKNTNNTIKRNSKNSSDDSNMNSKQSSMLAKAFRILHDQGGTTAVLNGCRETLLDYEAPVLVEAALLAGNPVDGRKGFRSKGISSGILNALLGCCCSCSSYDDLAGSSSRAEMAIELMRAYDAIGKNQQQNAFEPDLVALCLAYVATSGYSSATVIHGNANDREARGDDNDDTPIAAKFLRRAEHFYHGPPATAVHDTEPESNATKPKPNLAELEERYDIQVLQDAEEFAVLSKPSGMVCYHGAIGNDSVAVGPKDFSWNKKGDKNRGKGKRNNHQRKKRGDDESLEECLLAHGLTLSTLNQEGRGLVHRIDRGTSGCLVVAKTNRMHAFLLAQFFLRRSKKSYRALVCSSPEQLANQNSSGEVLCAIDGRPARSKYSMETSVGKYLSRIKVETGQGRRHQVRIHCSEGLNAPILLDPLYGGQSILSTLLRQNEKGESRRGLLTLARVAQKFCLHASTLKIDAAGIDAEAPLPEWWQQLEEELR
jgi:23S rRNA-/tRNA-specific pseudouridylate synthase